MTTEFCIKYRAYNTSATRPKCICGKCVDLDKAEKEYKAAIWASKISLRSFRLIALARKDLNDN